MVKMDRVSCVVEISRLCASLRCDEMCEVAMTQTNVAYCVCTVGYVRVRVDDGQTCSCECALATTSIHQHLHPTASYIGLLLLNIVTPCQCTTSVSYNLKPYTNTVYYFCGMGAKYSDQYTYVCMLLSVCLLIYLNNRA